MTEVEKNCRICRGEGNEAQPLLHPCKCRGSIKYIHQDCLMEWLKHSNKSTKQCDICNTPYKFKTIYDPAMPERMPLNYVWEMLQELIKTTAIKSLSIFLYITCIIIQVPLYWKFMGRIYTWSIDGKLPATSNNFLEALLFGGLDFSEYDVSSSPARLFLFKLNKFFSHTYFSGFRYIAIFIIVHIALFVEHEWVVRDEGYTKLLMKKLGKEPRTKLVDILQQTLQGLRNEGTQGDADANANLQRLELLARAINDLQDQPNNLRNEEALRRAIEEGEAGDEDNNEFNLNVNNFSDESSDVESDNDGQRRTIFLRPENMHRGDEQFGNGNIGRVANNDEEFGNNREFDNRADIGIPANLHAQVPHPQEEPHRVADPEPPIVPAQAPAQNRANQNNFDDDFNANDFDLDDEAEAEAAENVANGDILDFLGIKLNLSEPIFILLLCDVVISVYLFVIYLIPHMIGNFIASVIGWGMVIFNRIIISPTISYFNLNTFTDKLLNEDSILFNSGNAFVDFSILSISEYIVKPFILTINHLFIDSQPPQPTLVERILLLTLGYGLISCCIYKVMNILTNSNKPILGTPRKVYKILFEIASTAKVFLIFSIEIFFFPVYCGWLLDFCVAPLLLERFTKTLPNKATTFVLFYSSTIDVLKINYIRIVLYWASGTLYMLFFALFVGMIRGKILRPGVLFFIRSPDDPNARLIHDALVKPLMLQLSRIYLSAKVYTGFVLIGIGGVTWGLRYLVTPADATYNVMLPLQIYSINSVIISSLIVAELLYNKALLTKYCLLYWTRVFEISTHKLRLSHFILGKPISQERGYIKYRNLFQSLLGTSQPDYSRPVTSKDAEKIFEENPYVNACFIPDGNYIRAPDNDTVSRKFIKKLFVNVTKDDKLLSLNEVKNEKHEYESDSSDEELNDDNAYTIVYTPPNFKLRCFFLVGMLWVFSVILILSIIIVSLLVGRPVVKAAAIVSEFLDSFELYYEVRKSIELNAIPFDWKLADLSSIFLGVKFQLALLQFIDRKWSSSPHNAGANEVNNEQNDIGADGFVLGRNLAQHLRFKMLTIFMLYLFSSLSWVTWSLSVHKLCIDFPLRLYTNNPFEKNNNIFVDFLITKYSIILHFIVSFWTMVPTFFYFPYDLRNGIENDATIKEYLWKSGFMSSLINYGLLHLPASVIVFLRHKSSSVSIVERDDVYVWALQLLIFIIIKLIIGAHGIFKKISEQVKTEKYVKGSAIENLDDSDED